MFNFVNVLHTYGRGKPQDHFLFQLQSKYFLYASFVNDRNIKKYKHLLIVIVFYQFCCLCISLYTIGWEGCYKMSVVSLKQ